MDLTSSKIIDLARYWQAKRVGRAMPLWSDIDPAEIKPLLPHLLVSRFEREPFRVRYVLVGTWLVEYSGGDYTGRYLDELDFASEIDSDWDAYYRRFVAEAVPTFGIGRFLSASGVEHEYEWGAFPIAGEDGVTVERSLDIEDFPAGTDTLPDARIVTPRPRLVAAARDPASGANEQAAGLEPVSALDPGLRRALGEARLSTAVRAGPATHFFQLMDAGRCRGYGGFEILPGHALLHSIVIEEPSRGRGYGRILVRGLLDQIRWRGIGDVYLLTESAAPFFAKLGFTPSVGAAAPPEIATTQPFQELCSADTTLMRMTFR